ncbi:hypothetical protein TNCV_3742421 [Trichonephila clavipes]|nr:hypothetical protein TNCV_3742421 [Trichonephila clavipes]
MLPALGKKAVLEWCMCVCERFDWILVCMSEMGKKYGIERKNGVANWSHCSLYPASNQKVASKLSAKPKNSKKIFSFQMKHHSHVSRFHRSTNRHHAPEQNGKTTFVMPSIINSHDLGLRTVLRSSCLEMNAYSSAK